MADPDPFFIERLEERDTGALVRLLGEYLGPIAPRRHEWLYLRNPHGRARTFVARQRESGRLVGCTSLFPRRVAVDDVEVTAALGGDAYVVPAMRRRGLAQRLHVASLQALGPGPPGPRRDAFRSAQEEGRGELAFMFGPPAPANLRVLKRVGSVEVRTLRHFTAPVTGAWMADWLRKDLQSGGAVQRLAGRVPAPLLREVLGGGLRLLSLRFLGKHRPLLEIGRVDGRLDDLWHRARPHGVVVPVRDAAYLQWRFLDAPGGTVRMMALPSPGGGHRLSGYAAIGVAPDARRLLIHDLLGETSSDVVALMHGLHHFAQHLGMEAMSLRMDQAGPYIPALLWAGFLPAPEAVSFQILTRDRDYDPVAAQAALQPWLFTLGDEDWSGVAHPEAASGEVAAAPP